MKKTITLALLFMSALSIVAQKYSVRGTVNADNNGKYVYIAKYENKGWVKTDSALIQDNQFKMEGSVDSPRMAYFLTYNGDKELYAEFILENAILPVNLTIGETLTATVMGTKANTAYEDFKALRGKFSMDTQPIRKQMQTPNINRAKVDSLRKAYYDMGEKLEKQVQQLMYANSDNYVGLLLLNNYYMSFSLDKVKEQLAKVPAELHNDKIYTQISNYASSIEKTSEGKPFLDITGKTPEGKDIKLSDYAGKGKVVLVDFWASWCGPCIAEMPNVVKAYEQYKAKGLEIVGVSLDNKEENWKKALAEHKMTWPQLSDLKGWKSQGAIDYTVKGIPATVLIGADGTIIARNLRGPQLISKLAELLK